MGSFQTSMYLIFPTPSWVIKSGDEVFPTGIPCGDVEGRTGSVTCEAAAAGVRVPGGSAPSGYHQRLVIGLRQSDEGVKQGPVIATARCIARPTRRIAAENKCCTGLESR